MNGSRPARAALLVLALAAAGGGGARAQGVVLSPEGLPLPVRRVRALLVFQERGKLCYTANRPNRQDLLVELELAAPAPAGARWILCCPAEAAAARAGEARVLDEVGAFWRDASRGQPPAPWPAADGSPERLSFRGPLAAEEVEKLLPAGGGAPGPAGIELTRERGGNKWTCFAADLPAGAGRVGPGHVTFQALTAVYPGSAGAAELEPGTWSLPPLDLAVLHSHFINVNDNPWGLGPVLGFSEHYRDPGTLKTGRPLWDVPEPARIGEQPGPGVVRADAGVMPATAEFLASLGADGDLFLTALEGRPGCPQRAGLDFGIYSHYPSAVETVGQPTAFIVLGICLVVMVGLAAFMLKRKGFVHDLSE